jgi:hypothetical protein
VTGIWLSDTHRRDGLRLERSLGTWVIVPARGEMLARCPCCNAFLTTSSAARTVADRTYSRVSLQPPLALVEESAAEARGRCKSTGGEDKP